MKKLLILVIILWAGATAFAQSTVEHLTDYIKYIDSDESPSVNIFGSIYLNQEFQPGTIINKETGKSEPAELRYNALEDLVEIKIDNSSEPKVLPKVSNLKYDFNTYSVVFKELETTSGLIKEGYFLEYYSENDLLFFAKPILTAKKDNLYNGNAIKLFVDYEYFIGKNNEIHEVNLRESNLEKYFSDKGKMKTYFAEKKIRNEYDVVDMLQFYSE